VFLCRPRHLSTARACICPRRARLPLTSASTNGQQNITQEIRLQSTDPNARLLWNHRGILQRRTAKATSSKIHDPLLNELCSAGTGAPYTDFFVEPEW